MKIQNDSPQPLKSKFNCCGMGCSFDSASSLQMVTACSMTIKAQIQKNFDEYVLPYWRTRTVGLAWHCLKRYLHDPADLIFGHNTDFVSLWEKNCHICVWMAIVKSLGNLKTRLGWQHPPGASHCSQPMIFVKSVWFLDSQYTQLLLCAQLTVCYIQQTIESHFYCKSGRMCRTRDDRRPFWRYDTKCHGWL